MQTESRTCQACLGNYAEMQLCLSKVSTIHLHALIRFVSSPNWFVNAAFFISKHPTTVKNTQQIFTFLPKLLHNSNKSRTFAAPEPAKPLNDAQPTTNREQCQTCLNIAEVRRRKRLLEAQMSGSFFLYENINV